MIHPVFRVVLVAASLACLLPTGSPVEIARADAWPTRLRSPARVSVEGSQLLAGGHPVLLRGVNVSAYSDDDSDDVAEVLAMTSEADYQAIAREGFNAVRLNLWSKAFAGEAGWAWLRRQREWASKHGLWIILDLHAPPGGYQGPEYKGTFWKDPALRRATMVLWEKIITEVRDDPSIAALDILNEPKPTRDEDWHGFVAAALPTMRKAGWSGPVIVEKSLAKGAGLRKFNDPAIIYDAHFYEPWEFVTGKKYRYGVAPAPYEKGGVFDRAWLARTLQEELAAFGEHHRVPVNVGEYGMMRESEPRGGMTWLGDLETLFEQKGISRQIWCWHTFPGWALDRCARSSGSSRRVETLAAIHRSR